MVIRFLACAACIARQNAYIPTALAAPAEEAPKAGFGHGLSEPASGAGASGQVETFLKACRNR